MHLSYLTVLIAVLFLMPAVGFSQPKHGGTLNISIRSDPTQLDPIRALSWQDSVVGQLAVQSLVEPDKNFKMVPGLAESWDISTSGKEWTFHLRKGVKFHNGRELTSDDVKWNLDRMMDPAKGAVQGTSFRRMIDSIEVVDRYTIKFILKVTAGGFLDAHGGTFYRAPILAKESFDEEGKLSRLIGTGPFEFVEWKVADHIRFKRYADYWEKGLPYVDEVIIKPMPDEIMRLTALRTGDLDISTTLPPDEVERLKKREKDFTFVNRVTEFGVVFFNLSRPPFNNEKVRQAWAYGIDKEEMMIAVTNGTGEVINQPFPPESHWYLDVPERKRDIEKAKALLKEAGYPNGVDVELTISLDVPWYIRGGETQQDQLKEIGFRIKIDRLEWGAYVSKVVANEDQAFMTSLRLFSDPDQIFPTFFYPDGSFSIAFGPPGSYGNQKVVELLRQGGMEMNLDKRKKLYAETLTLVEEDVPWIVYTTRPSSVGWRNSVKGFEPPVSAQWVYMGGGLAHTWLDE